MKVFQKKCPLVAIMLLLSGGIFFVKSKESEIVIIPKRPEEPEGWNRLNAESEILNAHIRVFAEANLFSKKNKNTRIWFKMLSDLQRYVVKNAGNSKKLLDSFSLSYGVISLSSL